MDEVVTLAERDAAVEAQASPEVLLANAEWSACMENLGYVYADPFQAREANVGRVNDDVNQMTRVADLTCQETSGWMATYEGVRAQIETNWIEANPTIVAEIEAAKHEAMTRATNE